MSDIRNAFGRPALVDDVLLKILCECDIATVLSAGLASRSLHTLSSSKHVWLALLSDLQRRGFVDLRPNQKLKDLATSELVNIAKRIVNGPETWSPHNPSLPVITRQIILKPDIHTGPGILYRDNDPRLLPGGRFLLFLNGKELECWDIIGAKLVWVYPCRWAHGVVQAYTMEVVDDETVVMILVGIRTYEESRKNHIEAVRLDLHTYISTSVLVNAAPDTRYDAPFYRLKIHGDLAIARMHPSEMNVVIVVQLSKAKCSLIQLSEFSESSKLLFTESDVTLVAGHVVAAYPQKGKRQTYKLGIWSAENLLTHQEDQIAMVDIETFDPVALTLIKVPKSVVKPQVLLGSHPSPLHRDSTVLWALLWPSQDRFAAFQVYKFHITPPSITQALHRTFHGCNLYGFRESFAISFAGYMNIFHEMAYRILSLEGSMKDVDLLGGGNPIHMSAYSGAITYSTSEKVVVNYYE